MTTPAENVQRREWWHDDFVQSRRLADGSFPRYEHSLGATVHGDQYMAPWHVPGRGNYLVDDFGNWSLVREREFS